MKRKGQKKTSMLEVQPPEHLEDRESLHGAEADILTHALEAYRRIYRRKQNKGKFDLSGMPADAFNALVNQDAQEFTSRVAEFILDHNEMAVRVWNGERCQACRAVDHEAHGKVRVLKHKCIDGRDPRAFDGEADSTKVEEAQIALRRIESDSKIVPLQAEICDTLRDVTQVPLIMNGPHFDSYLTPANSCAAIEATLEDENEEVWKSLTDEEVQLVRQARLRGNHEANMVLNKLGNSRAVKTFHNNQRVRAGLHELERIDLTFLYDTRTLGMVLKAPVLQQIDGKYVLAPEDRPVLVTADIAKWIAGKVKQQGVTSVLPYGSLRHTFNKTDTFEDFDEAVTLTAKKSVDNAFVEDDPMTDIIDQTKQAIRSFLTANYGDLEPEQMDAAEYEIFRYIWQSYFAGLAHFEESHPFSHHKERFISVSKDARFIGKYDVEYQCFIISVPDTRTGDRRMAIGSDVMTGHGMDQGKAHALFINTSIDRDVWENRAGSEYERYREAANRNVQFFRETCDAERIKDKISKGEVLPIGVFVDAKTGAFLGVNLENYDFL